MYLDEEVVTNEHQNLTQNLNEEEGEKNKSNTQLSPRKSMEFNESPNDWSSHNPAMLRRKKNELLKAPKRAQPNDILNLKRKILEQQLEHCRIEHEQKIKHAEEEHELRMKILSEELKSKQNF